VDSELNEEIEATIHTLRLAQSRIGSVSELLREYHSRFVFDYDRTHEDIAQVISRMRYMKRLAERRDGGGALLFFGALS
jgi:hypothetical protein